VKILRNDSIWNNEVKWQLRQNSDTPVVFADIPNDRLADSLLAPGDTMSFTIDVRPSVVGLKRDSLFFNYNDGLQVDSVLIPMSVLSTWTIHYEITDSRTRPTTPSRTNEFIDTIYIYNNKDNRTRITSMRLGINFNPRNVMIKEFMIDTTLFPNGWTWQTENVGSTEKYGKLFFTAQAEINKAIIPTASKPEELSYFTKATGSNKTMLGYFRGIQLLGTSDTTDFVIDTSYSQHNFDKSLVLPRDINLVNFKLPYIKGISGRNISDSLIFQNKLLLNSNTPSGTIQKVYPNPVDLNKQELQIEFDFLKDNSKIKFKIIEIFNGFELASTEEIVYEKKGHYKIPIDIAHISNGAKLLLMETDMNKEVWLVNFTK